jgi:hypothetical protein
MVIVNQWANLVIIDGSEESVHLEPWQGDQLGRCFKSSQHLGHQTVNVIER